MRAYKKVLLPVLLLTAVLIGGWILQAPVKAAGDVPLLSDAADLLTDKEEGQILKKLEKISDKRDCDIAVYTTGDLGGQEAIDYVDDLVDSIGLGENRSKGTATLLVFIDDLDPQNREVRISTDSKGSAYFSDNDIDYVIDEIIDDLSGGNYANAFSGYVRACDEVLAESSDDKKGGSRGVSPFWIFGDLGIGAAIATLLGQRQKSKLKTAKKKSGAYNYTDHDGIIFEVNEDVFLDRRVERRRIERDTDREGSHEHGTTHTSSSGKTHGGGGRKF